MNKHQNKKSYFITIEGIEGAGKTSALAFLQKKLIAAQIDFVLTREPGGTEIADAIRQLVLLAKHTEKMCEDTELLLMFASRAQNIEQNIKPALAQGKWVICDRFTDASYAYQGGGRRIPMQRIAVLENWVHPDLQPDITLLLDAPAEVGLARIEDRKTKDRIEHEKMEFFTRVRETYLQRAKQYPERFRVIDASKTFAEVEQQLLTVLQSLL
jgi:dTMP kinase